MAVHSVGAWDKLHESEASEALVFCFDNVFTGKSCFVVDLVCFFSLCRRVAVFLNATSDRSVLPFASQGKSGSMQFAGTIERSSRSPRELRFVRYISG